MHDEVANLRRPRCKRAAPAECVAILRPRSAYTDGRDPIPMEPYGHTFVEMVTSASNGMVMIFRSMRYPTPELCNPIFMSTQDHLYKGIPVISIQLREQSMWQQMHERQVLGPQHFQLYPCHSIIKSTPEGGLLDSVLDEVTMAM